MRARRGWPRVGFVVCVASSIALPEGLQGQVARAGQAAQQGAEDRIWGVVTTTQGRRHEGFLRWDLNEAAWADVLHGSKAADPELQDRIAETLGEDLAVRGRSVEYLGVRISWERDGEPPMSQSGIPFGHLLWLEVPTEDEPARLGLKSGEELLLSGRSSDLGPGLRAFVVEDPRGDRTELGWRDVARVDFRPAPATAAPSARRLYGTIEDRWGDRWTGFVSWDLDEALTSDILDGEEDGRDRDVPFADIRQVDRRVEGGARVTLVDGREMVLEGTNDVDDGHRGIHVSDPHLGQIALEWGDVRSVRFAVPTESAPYHLFDGGTRLRGTVSTEGGETLVGRVIWDADESWTWESLDGSRRGRSFEVEFRHIARIERRSSRGVEVTLRDGRTLDLRDSTDVDESNRGIVIELDDGGLRVLEWDEFESVDFAGGAR